MEARVLYRGELGLDPALVAYGGKIYDQALYYKGLYKGLRLFSF